MKREQRFCVCGWSIYGTDLERRNAMASHRESDNHKRRMAESASNIDGLVEADIARRSENQR